MEKIKSGVNAEGRIFIEHRELGITLTFDNASAAAEWEAAFMLCMSINGDEKSCFCRLPPQNLDANFKRCRSTVE